ncbi:MAG: hypothetical protein QOC81_706 [Thermoanaerobaculia bacterium]|nr:hypothetical protein [Thermoanaerobaculia bacterium]
MPEETPKHSDEPGWFERKFDVRAIRDAVGADFREFALLWLVFSLLDKYVSDGKLDVPYVLGNSLISVMVWLIGASIEYRK